MQLHLAEAPHIEGADGTLLPLTLRDAALLAWLALEGPTPRDRLGALLWPASTQAQARTTLRQRLFQMKKLLGADVAQGSPLLQLAPGVQHDLAQAADLLGGQHLPDAPELDTWLQRQREQRHRREQDALSAQAQALEAAGDPAAALPVALALLRLDPLSELAHQRVMRLHYLLGDRAAALQAFDACERVLKDEVGTRPSAQTLALLGTIEQSGPVSAGGALRQLPAAVLRPPRLVGRDREVQRLQRIWAHAKVAAITGEAGMGKSRLLEELAHLRGDTVRVAGRPGDASVPYATLARLLRAVSERSPATQIEPEPRAQLARVLPELGTVTRAAVTGQRLALQQALANHLQASSALQGVLLDDLHFADTATLEMLPALITDETTRGLRWALAFRPTESGSPVLALQAVLSDAALLEPVSLQPLDTRALAELVNQLGLGLDGAALAPQLLQRTGGNPLFVLETLKAAWAEEGAGALGSRPNLPHAASLQGLIDKRIAQLSPGALALARVASIAGVDFSIAIAESVLGVGAMLLADALRELESAQVLRGTQFAHDLILDAVLRSVPHPIAEHSHAQVALWLEHHAGEPARIAQHWIDAQQAARALPWLTQAAERAAHGLRNAELLAFLDLRARIEEDEGMRGAALKTQVEALDVHRANERSAEAGYERCDALDRLAQTPEERIQAWLARSEFQGARKEGDLGLSLAEKALAEAQRTGSTECIRKSQIWLASALHDNGKLPQAMAMFEACLGWIDEQTDLRLSLGCHSSLAHTYSSMGLLSKARAQYKLSQVIAEQCDDPLSSAIITSSMANTLSSAGHVVEAIRLSRQSLLRRAQFETNPSSNAVCRNNLAIDCARVGHFMEALAGFDEAERLFTVVAPSGLPLLWGSRAQCWLRLGQHARATPLLSRIAAAVDKRPAAAAKELQVRFQLGRDQGQPDPGLLRRAMDRVTLVSNPFFHLILQIEYAATLPSLEALAALDDARERALEREYGGQALDTHLLSAQVALAVDVELARDHAQQAMEMFEQIDPVSVYRAETWLQCGKAFLAAGDDNRALGVIEQGAQWVTATAREHVPPEFVESFLHRNPINVQLLALAARHGIAAPG